MYVKNLVLFRLRVKLRLRGRLSFRLRLVVWLNSYIKITTERNAWFSKVDCMHPLIATITLSEVISLRILGQVISHMSLWQFCIWYYRSKKPVSWRATTSCKDEYQGLEEIRQHQIQLQHSFFRFQHTPTHEHKHKNWIVHRYPRQPETPQESISQSVMFLIDWLTSHNIDNTNNTLYTLQKLSRLSTCSPCHQPRKHLKG